MHGVFFLVPTKDIQKCAKKEFGLKVRFSGGGTRKCLFEINVYRHCSLDVKTVLNYIFKNVLSLEPRCIQLNEVFRTKDQEQETSRRSQYSKFKYFAYFVN